MQIYRHIFRCDTYEIMTQLSDYVSYRYYSKSVGLVQKTQLPPNFKHFQSETRQKQVALIQKFSKKLKIIMDIEINVTCFNYFPLHLFFYKIFLPCKMSRHTTLINRRFQNYLIFVEKWNFLLFLRQVYLMKDLIIGFLI